MTRIFDLPGPAFMTFYGLAWLVVGMLAWTIRRGLATPNDTSRLDVEKLDVYEVAWLKGRGRAVADAVLASLMHEGVISVQSAKVRVKPEGQPPKDPPRIEVVALTSLGLEGSATLESVRATLMRQADALFRPALERAGLVLSAGHQAHVQLLSATPALLLLLLGGIKLLVGLSRHKPALFLFLGSGVGILALFVWLASDGWWRTGRGDAALEQLGRRHAALQRTVARGATSWTHPDDPKAGAKPAVALSGADVALACGLWGVTSLGQPALLPIQQSLAPPSQGGSGCGIGGSACGSGSSCGGGGGCGGGGCGGCGG
jgi:uncharacterized protein (TIGR04222 family)